LQQSGEKAVKNRIDFLRPNFALGLQNAPFTSVEKRNPTMEENDHSSPATKSRTRSFDHIVMSYAIDEATGRICIFENGAEPKVTRKRKKKSAKSPNSEAN